MFLKTDILEQSPVFTLSKEQIIRLCFPLFFKLAARRTSTYIDIGFLFIPGHFFISSYCFLQYYMIYNI